MGDERNLRRPPGIRRAWDGLTGARKAVVAMVTVPLHSGCVATDVIRSLKSTQG